MLNEPMIRMKTSSIDISLSLLKTGTELRAKILSASGGAGWYSMISRIK